MDRKLNYIKKLIKDGLPRSKVMQRFEKKFGEFSHGSVLYNSVMSSEFSNRGGENPEYSAGDFVMLF
jgi:hypothetical protein